MQCCSSPSLRAPPRRRSAAVQCVLVREHGVATEGSQWNNSCALQSISDMSDFWTWATVHNASTAPPACSCSESCQSCIQTLFFPFPQHQTHVALGIKLLSHRLKRTYAGSSSFLYGPGGPYLGAPLATRHSKALNVPCTAVQMTIAPEWFLAVSECNMCCEKRPSRAEYIVFVKLDVGWTTDVEQFKTRRHTGITTVPWMTPGNVYTSMCCNVGTAVAWQCQGRGSVWSPCSA